MSFIGNLARKCEGINSSHRLALGLTLGAAIGIVPKDTALFVGLLVLLIISGANFVTGMLATAGGMLLAPATQETMHAFGASIFQVNWCANLIDRFLQLPYAAWTRLDNSIVLGSFTACLLGAIPLYFCTLYVFEKNREFLIERIYQSALFVWIVGADADQAREG